MCIPRRTGAKVQALITYNFDDLVERQLLNQAVHFHTIFCDNDFVDPDELPIYHVHGFLPKNDSNYEDLDRSTLVFSEEGYHQIYSDSYHWSNLVQLQHLRENHCLMVGLSMTDPNLRRLLDISARNIDKTRHYAFMKRLTVDTFIYEQDKTTNRKTKVMQNEDAVTNFLYKHHKLNEEIMKELGVSIIWYTEYAEIPQILKRISNKNEA